MPPAQAQRLLLRRLLAYTRWMYEDRSPSVLTKAWFLFIKYCYVRRCGPDPERLLPGMQGPGQLMGAAECRWLRGSCPVCVVG